MDISLNFSVSVTDDGSLIFTSANKRIISFSKDQIVQRKVCMVALGELTGLPKIQIAKLFGYSNRQSYYDIRNDVLNGTGTELIPESPGPKSAPKKTKELEALVIKMRFETDDSIDVIASKLNKLGFKVSPRLVKQILMDYGLSKKKSLQTC